MSLDELFFRITCFRERFPDKLAMHVAWALPRRVVYWAYIRVIAHATSGPHGMTHAEDVTYTMACKRWEAGPHPESSRCPDDVSPEAVPDLRVIR